MKRFWSILALAFVLIPAVTAHGAGGGDPETRFRAGVSAYRSGAFAEASAVFEDLARKGIQDGHLFYNLGNAYLKQDRLGHAILWYERALTLMPHDPDLGFNYDFAISLTRDERAPSASPVVRILFFWKYILTTRQLQWISLVMNGAFWVLLILRQALGTRRLKAPLTAVMILAAVASLTVAYNAYESVHVRKGIVLAEEAAVRSGLTDQATELFLLHAGAKVDIDREKDGYYRIRYSRDKIGWIRKEEVGRI